MASHYRERLIDEVRRRPVLYDTRHAQHRDIDAREKCWHDIALKLGASSDCLKREWKILRDSMRQAVRRTRQGARTQTGLPVKRWRFHSRMEFVLPYITVRERRRVNEEAKLQDSEVQSDMEHLEQSQAAEPEQWETDAADNDGLDLFFASVCQSTKRLPRRLQNQVKREVLDVLLRAEEEFEADPANTKLEVTKVFSEMD